jgi:hypothetical protein
MAAQPAKYTVDDETRAKPLIKEARSRPVVVEIDGTEYSIVVIPSSPFTLESAFGSAPIRGKDGQPVSDDELEAIIDRAKEEHAAHVVMDLNDA